MGYDFDLFVIGGGSGGVRAARVTAALRDKRVVSLIVIACRSIVCSSNRLSSVLL